MNIISQKITSTVAAFSLFTGCAIAQTRPAKLTPNAAVSATMPDNDMPESRRIMELVKKDIAQDKAMMEKDLSESTGRDSPDIKKAIQSAGRLMVRLQFKNGNPVVLAPSGPFSIETALQAIGGELTKPRYPEGTSISVLVGSDVETALKIICIRGTGVKCAQPEVALINRL